MIIQTGPQAAATTAHEGIRCHWLECHNQHQPAPLPNWLLAGRPGDLVVEFGLTPFEHSQQRALQLAERGMGYIDIGMTGNMWGVEYGFAMAVGGDTHWLKLVEPILNILAPLPEQGWLHAGGPGCGHFVRQIHALLEQTLLDNLAQFTTQWGTPPTLPTPDPVKLRAIWQRSSELRDTLLTMCELFANLLHPPYRDFHQPDQAEVSSPACQLAQVIRFAAQTSRDFDKKLNDRISGFQE
ncbi:hypothetical protein HNQ59_002985 [Chitinivorax tropicus]|uniref:6-phosphogluconate dehydrogenase NADP-binding domain-containing protein n=1 Tax=Chitinivorax tropicus TaxID=714531 RepID=A0A840MRE5_9PROT|nr:hypothetical protein [Chitinivorax tropicus]